MSADDFDKAVAAKVPEHYQPIVARLRELMREGAPEAEEVTLYGSPGSPAWKGAKGLAVISVSKTHLTFAFDRGAEFTDAHGLLDGAGKKTRHVKIKSLDTMDEEAIRDYIAQAAALDKE
ncbi:DUF1801 domain-containing protein [Actinomadura sp. 21ATH]|uniref:DUF1801 domain-containing protein n=1 Tax=Actinomadura sp. 21ATH TaxID=1735444 RepID=UPI0035C0EDB2